jgi:K+-sensing histidine kinase KdpD
VSLSPSRRQLLKHPVTLRSPRPGLSAENQKKLFGKFARLSSKPTGGENSTGLGLSIVKKMVEAMNGRV